MKILIADDIEDARLILKKTLELAGYTVLVAGNGREALRIAQDSPPDIIVSDIMMPDMDGFRFCREVKQDARLRDIPFVFYTATYTDVEDEKLATALGASRFIVKPLEMNAFLEVINEVTEECKEGKLPVPDELLENNTELLRIYEERIQQKLDEKVKDLALERKSLLQREDALRESEQKMQAIFDSTIDGILVADVENKKFLTANKSLIAMLGYSLDEIKGLDVHHIHPEEDLPYVLDQFERQARQESVTAKDIPVKRKDGTVFYVDINSSPLTLGGRKYLIGVFREITERKKAEDIIRNIAEKVSVEIGEAFFQSVVKFLADTLGTKYAFIGKWSEQEPDRVKTIAVYASGKIVDNFEYNLADTPCAHVMGQAICEYPSMVAHKFPKDLLLQEMGVESYIGTPLFDFQKRSIGIMVVMDDKPLENADMAKSMFQIFALRTSSEMERMRAEGNLRQSEERFRAMFERAPIGISIASREGMIIRTNPEFQKMLGYTQDELMTEFSNITHHEDVSSNLNLFKEMTEGNRDFYKMKKRYIRKDGSIMWASLTVSAIRDENGVFKYNFAIVEDVSEKRRLEDQLRHVQKMEAIGQLAGGVAHDFNNILTAIIGYANLLKMKLKGDDQQQVHHIKQILAISERGAGLTQSLLAFSRKQAISLNPLKLNQLIERIGRLIPRLIGEEIEFRVSLSDREMTVMADSSQLEQVLMNLAGNARDAMPDGGVLSIETQSLYLDTDYVKTHGFGAPGPHALITVTDTGEGIDEETKKKIFEPFFTTKDVGEGTGLGLSLVYGIIKQHEGYINVYSELGQGTVFKIHLPLVKEELENHEEPEEQPLTGGKETILLAEDEAEVRGAMRGILEEYGFTIIEAVDGKDAVVKYLENKERVQLLLFDVVMPKMNGKEAYDEIKKTSPGVKVIFTSGYTTKTIHAKGVLEEGLHFLSKPVLPQNLLRKIREVLDES